MKNLIEGIVEKNGIQKLKILVEEENLYPEFFDDFENVKLIATINQIFEENMLCFSDVVKELKKVNTQDNIIANYQTLHKAISALFGNMQTFLNGLQKNCDKTYFKLVTNTIHSKYQGYRICYELRNVLQHKELNFSINQKLNETIKLEINVDDLLDEFNIKKNKREKIFGDLTTIDLVAEISEFYFAECEIYERIFLKLYDEIKYPRFYKYILQYQTPNNQLYISYNLEMTKKDYPREMKSSLAVLEIGEYFKTIQRYNSSQIKGLDLNTKLEYRNILASLIRSK